MNKQESLANAR